MATSTPEIPADFTLPRPVLCNGITTIPAPTYNALTAHFGNTYPEPQYLESEYGRTAVYPLPTPSPSAQPSRLILIHGASTPALGMLPLAHKLHSIDPTVQIVLFDLWGHGLSSTPLVAHVPQIFHFQILQVLSFMKWPAAHIVGYSFGGSTAASFAVSFPWAVLSVALLAPVGLISKEGFNSRMQELLDRPEGREKEARDCVLDWLEGGPLVVPEDWRDRLQGGEVVAEALREWELREHRGYAHSIHSIVRDGGVTGREEMFQRFARLPLKKVTVLADEDDVCSKELLNTVGVDNVVIVADANHGFVRSKRKEVASILDDFWRS